MEPKIQTTPLDGMVRLIRKLYVEVQAKEAGYSQTLEGVSSDNVKFSITLIKDSE